MKDNAIYHLAQGLSRLADYDFPASLNETTRGFFERTAALDPANAADFRALVGTDKAKSAEAAKQLSVASSFFNAQLRTTCVATRLEGGHANNALPQTAGANVNCRMLPQDTLENVESTLKQVLADPDHALSYALDIKEILADGDMAAVRLVWTLTSKKKSSGESKVTEEQGLDIFGRSSDGRWQIIRFMSFEK